MPFSYHLQALPNQIEADHMPFEQGLLFLSVILFRFLKRISKNTSQINDSALRRKKEERVKAVSLMVRFWFRFSLLPPSINLPHLIGICKRKVYIKGYSFYPQMEWHWGESLITYAGNVKLKSPSRSQGIDSLPSGSGSFPI